ncbi:MULTISPECIES: GFA family protein [unclassified Ruegeria]|uniref:GFA family protein n=1 Tax=unclassified Ruegeria TaxID=2625375 RepID=UPI0014885C17|nr:MULTISPECIES: GFA family protein [unclassified Ruegeria]NOD34574.1 GFA family protein [Ruegeria sp. HKCCD7296]NOE34881.1 GFA family protein [Ruegeria sp. HKCCD7318]NOE41956.1 GFA family protein [Ruegeria sp. HKCCD7319]
MNLFEGGCRCGRLRISASGRPLRVGICHCVDCRKHHGALFYAAAIFPSGAVKISGPSQGYADRFFCPTCGSPVFARSGSEVEVHLGCLDEPNQLTPTYECWVSRRECWLPEFIGMDRFEKDRDEAEA